MSSYTFPFHISYKELYVKWWYIKHINNEKNCSVFYQMLVVIISYLIHIKLVHGTGLAGLLFKFFFPVRPGTGTDSARWYWLYNWPGQPPAEQSRRLIRHAAPSVYTAHDTHYTHSVAVLNLSWQHSGKLLVFFANFCLSQSKLPIEKRPRAGWFSAFILIPARQISCGW